MAAKLGRSTRIVCCCEQGQVRSVAARYVLHRELGNGSVLACGLRKNDAETQLMLFTWADVVLVCGEEALLKLVPTEFHSKLLHCDVGLDVWGKFSDPNLLCLTRIKLEAFL